MSGFNKEVKKRTTELKTGIHLVSIIDAGIVKTDDGKPAITDKGEMGIKLKFADGKNHIFEQVYYTGGERERFFKAMCASANIDLEQVKKTGKFKAEAIGKRLWIYIKEVYDINGEELIKDDITGEPVINYYIFKTSFMANPDNRPAMKGDPLRNGGIATDEFVDYRQIFVQSLAEKAYDAIKEEEDDFADFEAAKPQLIAGQPSVIVMTTKGEVKGNKAFAEVWENKAMKPNDDFIEKIEPQKQAFKEEEIDFDNL